MSTESAPVAEIFSARSVAVIGASAKPGNVAARIVRNMIDLGFQGQVYPIGRSEGELFGLKMYHSVLALPAKVDLAVIAVPAAQVPSVLEECGQKAIPFATITSSGFGELGDERRLLDQQLLTTASRYGLRFLGPNCQGIRDFETNLSTRFGRQERQNGLNRSVGVIVQSGTISSTFERFLKTENIGLTRLASIGNKLNVDETDLLPAFLAHEPTKMVFLYLEGIRDGRRLFDIARNASKPIVLLKGNTSSTTAGIARSHSASVLNEQRVLEAAARQAGITLITDFHQGQIAAKAFQLPPLRGNRLVIFGGSGGMAVVAADWADRLGFELGPLPEATAKSIQSRLPGGYVKIGNPVDIGDFTDMTAILAMIEETLALPDVDAMVVCTFDPSDHFHNLPARSFAQEVKALMLRHAKPIALVYLAEREVIRSASAEADMPIFAGGDEAVRGLAILREHYRSLLRRKSSMDEPPLRFNQIREIIDRARDERRDALQYAEAFDVLSAAGIAVAAPCIVRSVDEAIQMRRQLNGNVCMKALLDDGAHKTESGAVSVGLDSDDAVRASFQHLSAAHEGAPICLQPTVRGMELMLGGRRDPHFGPVVSIGLGGSFIELLDDAALRLAPITRGEAQDMLAETRAARLLAGWRGAPAGDSDAVIDAIRRLAAMLAAFPEIVEIDVNPLMVLARGSGVCAVDVRILLDPGQTLRSHDDRWI